MGAVYRPGFGRWRREPATGANHGPVYRREPAIDRLNRRESRQSYRRRTGDGGGDTGDLPATGADHGRAYRREPATDRLYRRESRQSYRRRTGDLPARPAADRRRHRRRTGDHRPVTGRYQTTSTSANSSSTTPSVRALRKGSQRQAGRGFTGDLDQQRHVFTGWSPR
jgi:hypothetical protein